MKGVHGPSVRRMGHSAISMIFLGLHSTSCLKALRHTFISWMLSMNMFGHTYCISNYILFYHWSITSAHPSSHLLLSVIIYSRCSRRLTWNLYTEKVARVIWTTCCMPRDSGSPLMYMRGWTDMYTLHWIYMCTYEHLLLLLRSL